jgi:hypothetical protein
MLAPSTPKQQETELERETCIFDMTEAAINEAVLAQALAVQVVEQVRCTHLHGEVAGSGEATVHSMSIHLLL